MNEIFTALDHEPQGHQRLLNSRLRVDSGTSARGTTAKRIAKRRRRQALAKAQRSRNAR